MNNLDQGSVTDEVAARHLANNHPKSKREPPSFPTNRGALDGSPGDGAAPGANGPPTTGAIGPSGSLGSC